MKIAHQAGVLPRAPTATQARHIRKATQDRLDHVGQTPEETCQAAVAKSLMHLAAFQNSKRLWPHALDHVMNVFNTTRRKIQVGPGKWRVLSPL